MNKLAELNAADDEGAAALITPLIERAPAIAIRVASRRPFKNLDQLNEAIRSELLQLNDQEKINLFNEHPELAPDNPLSMTGESQVEQGRLNLTSDVNEHQILLRKLNLEYRRKFGFPFITALVHHTNIESVLNEFNKRVSSHRDAEIHGAIAQIIVISASRVQALFATDKSKPDSVAAG